jgi:5'-3' exonuclease
MRTCRFGVRPASIPDYLALVGDAADGYPGLPGWGTKSAAAVLSKFGHLELIPEDWREWRVDATNASALSRTLSEQYDRALLFRTLATLRTDIALVGQSVVLRYRTPDKCPGDGWNSATTSAAYRPSASNSRFAIDQRPRCEVYL